MGSASRVSLSYRPQLWFFSLGGGLFCEVIWRFFPQSGSWCVFEATGVQIGSYIPPCGLRKVASVFVKPIAGFNFSGNAIVWFLGG